MIKTHLEPVGHLQGQEALNMQWIKKTASNTDYSEEHMIQRLSKNGDTGYQITSKDTGGNEYMYSGYFTSGYGPVSDSLFPYDTTKSTLQIIPSILNAKGNYVQQMYSFLKQQMMQMAL